MLSIKPSNRPTIPEILNKSFVRKRASVYIKEVIESASPDLDTLDIDEMNLESLKEQADKLNLFPKPEVGAGGRVGGPPVVKRKPKKVVPILNEEQKKEEERKLKEELKEKEEIEKKLKELERETQAKRKDYQ